jgi:hypothetical protein
LGVRRITLGDSAKATTFKLEGKLTGAWVRELELAWVTASSASRGRKLVVDLGQVDFIDAAGKELLARMHAGGAGLLATGPWNRAVVEQIARAATALALGLLLLCGGKAAAQETVQLSLRDAVVTALKQNPQVRIAALNFAQAQEDILLARSGLLPQAGVRTFEEVRRFNMEALIGGVIPTSQQHVGPFVVFQAAPAFSVPLLDLTLWRRWRASQQSASAVGAQENAAREQVASLVISQYLGALRSLADVDAAVSRADLAQALYNQALELQKAGVGTGVGAGVGVVTLCGVGVPVLPAARAPAAVIEISKPTTIRPHMSIATFIPAFCPANRIPSSSILRRPTAASPPAESRTVPCLS